MKKGVLILLGLFMMVSTVEAKNGNYLPNNIRVNYSYNDAVNFTERGIDFLFSQTEISILTQIITTHITIIMALGQELQALQLKEILEDELDV